MGMAKRNYPFRYRILTESEIDEKMNEKQDKLTAGDNVAISEQNVISATDTKYTAGSGISISAQNVISATGSGSDTWTVIDDSSKANFINGLQSLIDGTGYSIKDIKLEDTNDIWNVFIPKGTYIANFGTDIHFNYVDIHITENEPYITSIITFGNMIYNSTDNKVYLKNIIETFDPAVYPFVPTYTLAISELDFELDYPPFRVYYR